MKSFIKKNIRFIIIVVICITCSVLTTFATTTLFNSSEVYYNNATSGIQADKVQGAIDELYACASNYAAYNQRLTSAETTIGSGSLTTTSQNLIGAVNGLNEQIGTFGEFTKITPTLPTGITSTDYAYSKIVKNNGSKIVHVDIYMTPTVNVMASSAFLQGFPVLNSVYGTNAASTLILVDYTNNTATRVYLLGDKLYTSSGLLANHLYMGGFTYFTT